MDKACASLLPVIDLMNGVVVRAVAGRRVSYQPVVSRISQDAHPISVASAFARRGFAEVYVADLDAIFGGEPNWPAYRQIAAAGLRLVIDAGTATADGARVHREFAESSDVVAGIVVGLESVRAAGDLPRLAEILGELGVFSLDLQRGRPVTNVAEWRDSPPLEIAKAAIADGFRRIIVLDLAAVGVEEGPATVSLCRDLCAAHLGIEVVSGGGVRSKEDVHELEAAGCRRVLVASALHDGRL